MKTLLTILALLFSLFATAQQQDPKTQAELEERMKAAQKEMDKLTPEQKKMLEQMGINTSPIPQMPTVSSKEFTDAMGGPTVPEKDPQKIASIAKSPLTAATMPVFISSAHKFVVTKLKPASKTLGEKIYTQLKADGKNNAVIGNIAAGLWTLGRVEAALYLMGKACNDDPTNTDNLNNYASMLSMSGAEQLAVPVLNNLNARFPRNSTVLNNLGQALFGLGEISKAEKYLDSVIRIYRYHPQANYTKSFIAESKGNKTEAITYVKESIKDYYSLEKHNRLRKLGYKLTASDLNFHSPYKPNSDPLGLHNFKTPPFPKSAEELVDFSNEWEIFITDLEQKAVELQQQWHSLTQPMINKAKTDAENYLNNKPIELEDPGKPLYYPVAKLMLEEMDKDGGVLFRYKSTQDALKTYIQTDLKTLKNEYEAELKTLNAREEKLSRESKIAGGFKGEDFCPQRKELLTKYLHIITPRFKALYKAHLKEAGLMLNEEIYWKQFSEFDNQFAITQLSYKLNWLSLLMPAYPFDLADKDQFEGNKCYEEEEEEDTTARLGQFDDMHCMYHSELNLVFGKIKTDCSKMTTELDLKFLKFVLKQDMDKETFGDQFIGCTVMVGVEQSIGKLDYGPLRIEAKVGAGVEFEFDRSGLKDVTIIAEAKAGAGTNVIDKGGEDAGIATSIGGNDMVETSIDIGVKARVSLVSGKTSVEGTGILK